MELPSHLVQQKYLVKNPILDYHVFHIGLNDLQAQQKSRSSPKRQTKTGTFSCVFTISLYANHGITG